jgi:hypothetical protein
MDETCFVERRFELDGGDLVVRFDAPFRAPGGEFQCRYLIGWPEGEVRSYACGLDGVQALMLAMRSVHSRLVDSEAYKAGRLTWCDEADLDLPPTWSAGPLYDARPPGGESPAPG